MTAIDRESLVQWKNMGTILDFRIAVGTQAQSIIGIIVVEIISNHAYWVSSNIRVCAPSSQHRQYQFVVLQSCP